MYNSVTLRSKRRWQIGPGILWLYLTSSIILILDAHRREALLAVSKLQVDLIQIMVDDNAQSRHCKTRKKKMHHFPAQMQNKAFKINSVPITEGSLTIALFYTLMQLMGTNWNRQVCMKHVQHWWGTREAHKDQSLPLSRDGATTSWRRCSVSV